MHQSLRLLAVIQAPIERIDAIIQRNEVLVDLIDGKWMTLAARSHGDDPWSIRRPGGTWTPWSAADDRVDYTNASREVR